MKKCCSCKEEKSYDCFWKLKTSADGYCWQCKECYYKKNKKYREKKAKHNNNRYHTKEGWMAFALAAAKQRAKRTGIPFDLSIEDLVFPEVCPILGIPLVINRGKGLQENSPSIDKVFPERGYVKGNVKVISFLANNIKRNYTDSELFRKIADYLETLPT